MTLIGFAVMIKARLTYIKSAISVAVVVITTTPFGSRRIIRIFYIWIALDSQGLFSSGRGRIDNSAKGQEAR